jgi:hypothetical protein
MPILLVKFYFILLIRPCHYDILVTYKCIYKIIDCGLGVYRNLHVEAFEFIPLVHIYLPAYIRLYYDSLSSGLITMYLQT